MSTAPDIAADEAAIRKTYAAWRVAVESGSIAGYIACLDENIRMMPPGGPDVVGVKAYEAFLQPVFDGVSYKIEPKGELDIEIMGDVATVRYDYVVRLTMEAEPSMQADSGALTDLVNDNRYFDVVRRQADGSWKAAAHIWNDNPA